ECPASSPYPPNRCCTTRDQVVPQSSSPHSAASAIRRSPGGSTPNSRRSRPEDPPSSATVTIAVTSCVTLRSADSDAASPCPPPSATTRGVRPGGVGGWSPSCGESAAPPGDDCTGNRSLPPQVAVRHRDVAAVKARRDLFGDRDRAVLAAGAAHRERHVPLAFPLESR